MLRRGISFILFLCWQEEWKGIIYTCICEGCLVETSVEWLNLNIAASGYLLQAHRETFHEGAHRAQEEAAESPDKNKVFPCQQCSKVFKRKFALKEHIRCVSVCEIVFFVVVILV